MSSKSPLIVEPSGTSADDVGVEIRLSEYPGEVFDLNTSGQLVRREKKAEALPSRIVLDEASWQEFCNEITTPSEPNAALYDLFTPKREL